MSCCPTSTTSSCCTPAQQCYPENFGLDFPSLVGPIGPPGGPGTFVDNYADLRALDASLFTQGYVAWVSGYSTINDGGSGNFTYDAAGVQADNGGTILAPNNGIGRWIRVYSYSLSARWFGATGDGVTDDTVKLQSAVTAAAGKQVFIPNGTYLISAAITVAANTTVSGDGVGTIIKISTGNISAFYSSGTSGVFIQDMKIRSESIGVTGYIGGVHFDSVTNSSVRNVSFVGMSWAGVYLNNSSGNNVSSCRFNGWLGSVSDSADIVIYRNSNYNVVSENSCYGGGFHGILIQDPYIAATPTGNTISGNVIGAHTAYGILVYVTTFYNTETVITSNTIRDISGAALGGASGNGIYIQSAGGVIADGNIISNCCASTTNFFTLAPGGIGVSGSSSTPVILSNNVIWNMPKGPGIHVNASPRGVIIDGNTINITSAGAASNERCIHVSHSMNMVITGNTLRQNNLNFQALNILARPYDFGSGLVTLFYDINISGNYILSDGRGVEFGVIAPASWTKVSICSNNIATVGIPLTVDTAVNVVVDANNCNSTGTFPLYLQNVSQCRVAGGVYMTNNAAQGPLLAGTGSGNIIDRSCFTSGFIENDPTSGFITEILGTAAPSRSGIWNVGDTVIQKTPVVGNPKQWRCTVAGNPGTWVSEGNL